MKELRNAGLLELAYQAVQPHRGPGAIPMTLVIDKGKLRMISETCSFHSDQIIMKYTKKMLREGLTGAEWDTLQKRLIKHQKEIKN